MYIAKDLINRLISITQKIATSKDLKIAVDILQDKESRK